MAGWFTSTVQPVSNKRSIPWETVEAFRQAWRKNLIAGGIDPDDPEDMRDGYEVGQWLRARGLPRQSDLARRFGIDLPRATQILKHGWYREAEGRRQRNNGNAVSSPPAPQHTG